ncbi:MAG: sensor histidine kinase [Gammaproteobacteria bacterium]|nr:MAG: sensor histidine kinase [Gammaproteobacteria bacterium]RLA51175.1 MAG: sensor histidine kinase [Gammaproteobacteria bacterium]
MIDTSTNISAARQNLRRLINIRYIALVGQGLTLFFFTQIYPLELPVATIAYLVLFFAAVTALTQWRSYFSKAISENEFFGHLLIDIIALTSVMYFSGGATNPFISYYLVPISIAAITLPAPMTWGVTAASLLAYSGLVFYHHPIAGLAPHLGHDGVNLDMSNLHVIGMWVNFALSAGLITYFVVGMANALRKQEAELTAQKEEQMQDEQLLAIATQAANAAHELGTPLNTMKLIIDNIKSSPLSEALNKDAGILDQQIDRCHKTLQNLVRAASIIEEHENPQLVSSYIDELLNNWQLIRPEINPHIEIDRNNPAITACFHPSVQQSLQNLLNNAADASPQQIEVNIRWNRQELQIQIRDHGTGITAEQAEKMGRPTPSNKPGGLGIGLFLSHSSLNRHGGQVKLANADGGGLLTSVLLPLRNVHSS